MERSSASRKAQQKLSVLAYRYASDVARQENEETNQKIEAKDREIANSKLLKERLLKQTSDLRQEIAVKDSELLEAGETVSSLQAANRALILKRDNLAAELAATAKKA